jgi:phosphatidylglycerophosphatase A
VRDRLVLILATAGGAGYFPFAPGTVGAAAGWLLYLLFLKDHPLLMATWIPVWFFIGVWVSTEAERIFGEKDSGRIVIDETVSYWISMAMLPSTWTYMILAFFLNRFFDITKPFGIRRVQRLPGGWGVMVDDLLSAVLANLVLQAFRIIRGE